MVLVYIPKLSGYTVSEAYKAGYWLKYNVANRLYLMGLGVEWHEYRP